MSEATDAAGNLVWKENYRPFGERLTNQVESTDNRQWFHGKAADADTGLQYFGARYYDPVLGRFMGVDPVGFQEDNIHSFNKYAYGNNNPYRFIDPDGRMAIPALIALVQAVTTRAVIGVAQRQAGLVMAAEIGAGVATGAANGGISAAEGLAARLVANNTSKVQAVIAETLSKKGNISSSYTLTANEILQAGEVFLGKGYKEIGKPGSGVFLSADEARRFRIDGNSLSGNHAPNIPHGHLETVMPGVAKPQTNNHIPFKD